MLQSQGLHSSKNKVEIYSKKSERKKGNDPFKLNYIASAKL